MQGTTEQSISEGATAVPAEFAWSKTNSLVLIKRSASLFQILVRIPNNRSAKTKTFLHVFALRGFGKLYAFLDTPMEVVSQDEFVEVYEHADPEKPSCIPRSFHPTA